MILDANILLYAVDSTSPHHDRASRWFTRVLNGAERVGLPRQTTGAFLRVATHPRVTSHPLDAQAARAYVDSWVNAPRPHGCRR
ncbi:TA system VapC family ribonuclease toxin [Pseudactinotalea sp. HY158]|uniref:TA system VapC family ribonuclease toxin n=1 Tax=Pseudactinotalea sp. HY158 TaxID=2654547 RepID=UPI00351A8E47